MIDVLANILDVLMSFFEWVGSLIEDILNVAVQVGKALLAIPDLISWLPTTITSLLIAGFAIVGVYKFLGREG